MSPNEVCACEGGWVCWQRDVGSRVAVRERGKEGEKGAIIVVAREETVAKKEGVGV